MTGWDPSFDVYTPRTMTPQEAAKGGYWPVGDSPFGNNQSYPENTDPTYPGKVPEEALKIKLWTAPQAMYAPGRRPWVDRMNTGEVEMVFMMTGQLDCLVEKIDTQHPTRHHLAHAADKQGVGEVCITLTPDKRRTWELSPGCQHASGITILVPSNPPPWLHWDIRTFSQTHPESFKQAVKFMEEELSKECYCLCAVFQGEVELIRSRGTFLHRRKLTPIAHTFLKDKWEVQLQPLSTTTSVRGIIVVFKT